MKKLILFFLIFYCSYVSAQVVAIPQVTGLPAALNSKVDKVTGKSLVADTSVVKLTGIQAGAQVNKIEVIQKNGVDLTITGKKVNITVPTTAAEIGAQPAGTYSTDIHGNISALNAVSNINTGDETTATIKTKLGITTLSGANTGDQTTVSGNAGTATKLQTSRTINGVAFDGTQNITINAVDATSRVASSLMGAANGVATLDANGIILTTQLPSYIDDVLEYTNLAAFPATGETGKIYVAKDTNKTYRWSGSVYVYITSGAVDSVNGLTGVVSLSKSDLGLGNLDNTSDANKPISTATQSALNGKQASGTYSTDIHSNITALNAVSGINGGDETLTSIKTKLGAASSSNSGYLTNTDWSTFNNKQPAGSYLTGITSGQVTTALGYTPWWSSNHPTTVSGYGITDIPSYSGTNFILNQNSTPQVASLNITGIIKTSNNNPNIQFSNTTWGSTSYIQTGVLADASSLGGDYLNIYNPEGKGFSITRGGVVDFSINTAGAAIFNSSVTSNKMIISHSTNPWISLTSTYNYVNNRNWDILTNGSAWGELDFLVSLGNGTAPTKSILNLKGNGVVYIPSTISTTHPTDGALVVAGGIGAVGINTRVLLNSDNKTPGYSTNSGLNVLSTNGLYGLFTGISDAGDVWAQVGRNDGNTDLYSLRLQPNGGNVEIGYSADQGHKLAVNGSARFAGKLSITDATDATIDPFPDGSIVTAGGIAAAKRIQAGIEVFSKGNIIADGDMYTGGEISAGTTITASGNIYSNGGELLTPVYQTQTTVNGSTSGNMICSMPFRTGTYKKVTIYPSALNGNAVYTFPTAFTGRYILNTTVMTYTTYTTVVASSTSLTITGASNINGEITIEGY